MKLQQLSGQYFDNKRHLQSLLDKRDRLNQEIDEIKELLNGIAEEIGYIKPEGTYGFEHYVIRLLNGYDYVFMLTDEGYDITEVYVANEDED
jgi:regulator of replication initiation timing